jgi:hypothetical protein
MSTFVDLVDVVVLLTIPHGQFFSLSARYGIVKKVDKVDIFGLYQPVQAYAINSGVAGG